MPSQGNETDAPKACLECTHWNEIKRKIRVVDLLDQLINKAEEKLKANNFNPSTGDYMKLLQIEKDLQEELQPPRDIKVTWIEPETLKSEG